LKAIGIDGDELDQRAGGGDLDPDSFGGLDMKRNVYFDAVEHDAPVRHDIAASAVAGVSFSDQLPRIE
jgi:hypothetical protein